MDAGLPGTSLDGAPAATDTNVQSVGRDAGCGTDAGILVAPFVGRSLSVTDNDVVFVDDSPTGSGRVRRLNLGTGDDEFVTAAGERVVSVKMGPSELFLLKEMVPDEGVRLYRSARSGAMPVPVGEATFPGLSTPAASERPDVGIVALRDSDVFVNDGQELSRTTLGPAPANSQKLIVATAGAGQQIAYPQLLGDHVYYVLLHDGIAPVYRAASGVETPMFSEWGLQDCGGPTMWMSPFPGGFLCGATGTIHVLDTSAYNGQILYVAPYADLKVPYNPSSVDGSTFYAVPGDPDHPAQIVELAVAKPMTPKIVACDVGQVLEVQVTPTDLVWIEARRETVGGPLVKSLRRIRRQ